MLLLILFTANLSIAQMKNGIVLDQETQQPISYSNIGIINKNVGTVSSQDGSFEIQLEAKYDTDSLRFSCIGYESQTYSIRDFRKQFLSDKIIINLVPKATILKDVIVTSESKKAIILGLSPKSRFTKAGFLYNRVGHEIGTLFEQEDPSPLYLDSVQLNFVTCNYDSIFLRINVYNINAERTENILPQNVFINLTKKQALANPRINLTSYSLLVGKKYLVSIEIVKSLGELGLKFYAALNVDRFATRYRGTSQDKWETLHHKSKPVGISIITYLH